MADFVTRFAPSPTGFMHIGNLRTALYAYLLARAYKGKFILRIEDTDQERYVEGATDVIYSTLKMTGLQHDEGPDIGGPNGPYIQSERKGIYMEYAKQLVEKGYAYYCFCTKERLDKLHEDGEIGAGYDRHCRDLPKEEVEKNLAEGKPFVIRQKMPLEGSTGYDDVVFGHIEIENSEMQDQILIKADGFPTYNFCHVIDDYSPLEHVVRASFSNHYFGYTCYHPNIYIENLTVRNKKPELEVFKIYQDRNPGENISLDTFSSGEKNENPTVPPKEIKLTRGEEGVVYTVADNSYFDSTELVGIIRK
jgi:glutamyl-tRNA synthetase